MLCVYFSSKSKATNIFPKHILKLKTHDQSIQARKKLFCPVTVNNYLCNIFCKFLIKIESTWRCRINDQTPQLILLYCGRTVRRSHWRCSIKKAVHKNFAIFTRKHLYWDLFLKRDPSTGVSCGYCKIFKTSYFEKHL